MSSKLTWFPLDVARLQTDEDWLLMSDEERGCYIRLLCHSWTNGGLPDDPQDLAELVGKPLNHPKWAKRVQKKFIYNGNGRLTNEVQEEFRTKALCKSEKATQSVRTRYERSYERTTERKPNVAIRASYSLSNSISSSSSEEKTRAPENFEFADWCEKQYARHPKKSKKFEAMHVLMEIFAGKPADQATFERNHAAHCRMSAWTENGGKYSPNLAQWISDEGWKYPPAGDGGRSGNAILDALADDNGENE